MFVKMWCSISFVQLFLIQCYNLTQWDFTLWFNNYIVYFDLMEERNILDVKSKTESLTLKWMNNVSMKMRWIFLKSNCHLKFHIRLVKSIIFQKVKIFSKDIKFNLHSIVDLGLMWCSFHGLSIILEDKRLVSKLWSTRTKSNK